MKIILTFLFILLLSLFSFSQTKLDSLIIVIINKYRVENNLSPVKKNDYVMKMSIQHLNYMIETKTVPMDHSQKQKTKFFKTFKTYEDRVLFFIDDPDVWIGEVTLAALKKETDDLTAEHIVNLWKSSPSHNGVLLDKDFKGIYVTHGFSNTLKKNDGNMLTNNYIYCVANLISK